MTREFLERIVSFPRRRESMSPIIPKLGKVKCLSEQLFQGLLITGLRVIRIDMDDLRNNV
jgi:hypothetical protein